MKSTMDELRWMDEEGEGLGSWWERQRSYKDERGLTCLPQMLQKINPQLPRKVAVDWDQTGQVRVAANHSGRTASQLRLYKDKSRLK